MLELKKCEIPGCENPGINSCEEPECDMYVCLEHSTDDPRLDDRPGFLCLPCFKVITALEAKRILAILQERK